MEPALCNVKVKQMLLIRKITMKLLNLEREKGLKDKNESSIKDLESFLCLENIWSQLCAKLKFKQMPLIRKITMKLLNVESEKGWKDKNEGSIKYLNISFF